MAISTRTRFEVFKRDAFTCQYCGRTPPAVILHADHIVPSSKGGTDDQANLVTSCQDCNLGKSNVLLTEAPPAIWEQIEEAKERAAQLEAYNVFLQEKKAIEDRAVQALGLLWFNLYCPKKNHFVFGSARVVSIRHFLKHLPQGEIQEAIELAHSRVEARCYGSPWKKKPGRNDWTDDEKTWKYFCGICWRKIKGE